MPNEHGRTATPRWWGCFGRHRRNRLLRLVAGRRASRYRAAPASRQSSRRSVIRRWGSCLWGCTDARRHRMLRRLRRGAHTRVTSRMMVVVVVVVVVVVTVIRILVAVERMKAVVMLHRSGHEIKSMMMVVVVVVLYGEVRLMLLQLVLTIRVQCFPP